MEVTDREWEAAKGISLEVTKEMIPKSQEAGAKQNTGVLSQWKQLYLNPSRNDMSGSRNKCEAQGYKQGLAVYRNGDRLAQKGCPKFLRNGT